MPFAVLQLVSGTVGQRVGLARTVRAAYALYALSSLAAALAPGIGPFLAARALQGVANAFLTPLLLAALTLAVPPGRVGRSIGAFASVQTAALVAAPLGGGLAAVLDWRVAFVLPALAAVVLACAPLPGTGGRAGEPPRLRSAFARRLVALGAGALICNLAVVGFSFLVALRAADALGLDAGQRGLLLCGFGAAGALSGGLAGRLIDAWGGGATVAGGALLAALAVPALGVVDRTGWLALAWALAGVGGTVAWGGLATMAAEAAPANRAGAMSVFSAWRFAGTALAPIVWLPVYERASALPFLAGGALCLALAALGLRLGARVRGPA